MSSASEDVSSASVPLLSGTASYGSKISGIIPCAQFLFESEPDTYYKGGEHAESRNAGTGARAADSDGFGRFCNEPR